MSNILLGFELETQETEGYNHDCIEPDTEAMWESAREAACDLTQDMDWLSSQLRGDFTNLNTTEFLALYEAMEYNYDRLYNVGAVRYDLDDVTQNMYDDLDTSGFTLEYPEDIDCTVGIIVDTDSSVKGFEFKTEGGNTLERVKQIASNLFELDHVVDYTCSFHIHVSCETVEHTEVNAVAMAEYILEHRSRIPQSVLDRLATGAYNYCTLRHMADNDKFSFIYRHRMYGTFEFRFFGNVQNAVDAQICLDLAHEAMQAVAAGRKPLVPAMPNRVWEQLMRKVLFEGKDLHAVMTPYMREEQAA